MRRKMRFIKTKIIILFLSLLGLNSCVLRVFSCAYGGPPESYEENKKVVEPPEPVETEVPPDNESDKER
ncbi:MAG: hypothetical protein IJP90_09450 [Treponema sp.]|nr:hypothetical protein [Treponema sp.]MBR0099924.1 hypothetical protein [Treponema sp.]